MTSRKDDLSLLIDAAREAGDIAMRYFKRNPEVWMKAGQSPVTEADFAVDVFLRETLTAARPGYGWLSEETSDTGERLSMSRTFVVDPIDGTRGFIEGASTWCISVAVVEAGRPVVGVLDCPAREEVYFATPGEGAWKNGAPIRVRDPGPEAVIGGPRPFFEALPETWRERVRRMSHVPSLAYRLAMIAEGALDATFVKPNAHDWDIAAADLILREAGGCVLNTLGIAPSYGGSVTSHDALVAGSGDLLAVIAEVIAQR